MLVSLEYSGDNGNIASDLADTPAQGDKAYWDNTAKEVTTTSTANTLIGVFIVAALNGDATVNVRLNRNTPATRWTSANNFYAGRSHQTCG